MELSGIILVDKPSGVLSSRVVSLVKRSFKEFGIRKVGHGGTLDKFASGLLVILLGKATGLFEWIKGMPKTYEGLIEFGEVRVTDDIYGEVIQKFDIKSVDREVLNRLLKQMEGEIFQIPPAYSSVHIQGRRAYQIAKKDYYRALSSLKPRKVFIYKLDLISLDGTSARILVKCSGGTYIRSIARDLGQLMGVGGYLKELRRIEIGKWHVNDAHSLEEIKKFSDKTRLVIPIEDIEL